MSKEINRRAFISASPMLGVAAVTSNSFGSETETVLRSFQSQRGLAADGVAGRQTFGAMDSLFNANDPFFSIPEISHARLLVQMLGPPDSRPFACTTSK